MHKQEVTECPICESCNITQIGNDKFGYGLVKLDLINKVVVKNPEPDYIAFRVYICNNCNHVELRSIPVNK